MRYYIINSEDGEIDDRDTKKRAEVAIDELVHECGIERDNITVIKGEELDFTVSETEIKEKEIKSPSK